MAALESALDVVRNWGEKLMPAVDAPRGSRSARNIHLRIGAGGAALLTAGLVVTGLFVTAQVSQNSTNLVPLALGILLAAISVFAPPVVFRTRSQILTEQVLSNPLAPQRPWRASTLTFDPIIAGAMLGALTLPVTVVGATFSVALVIRTVIQFRPRPLDPNARFHSLWNGSRAAIMGASAFGIVAGLDASGLRTTSPVPLLLGALVAMSVGLILNALERWMEGIHEPWAFARDAADTRRLAVILVSASIAWLGALTLSVGEWIEPRSPEIAGILAADGIFLAAWLLMWIVSVTLWRTDAQRTMRRWSQHQTDLLGRIADGSLDPDLVRRASLATTARMALSIFGATNALVTLRRPNGEIVRYAAARDRYRVNPPVDPRAFPAQRSVRIPIYSKPGHADSSDITLIGAIGPARFVSRSRTVTEQFHQLAAAALLTPIVASEDDRLASAFEDLFGSDLWPTMDALEQAYEQLRQRTDSSPQSRSLLIGVLAIDAFGALTGGRFEHAATAQVMRLVQGYGGFTGHEVFTAYEGGGRIWVAFGAGPVIRNGIGTLRDLQRHINDHGSVSAAHSDLGVHIEVSLGYAVQQVDDFTLSGLLDDARERLEIDQNARNPFEVDAVLSVDITPEDIIGGGAPAPATAIDVHAALRDDLKSDDAAERFPTTYTPMLALAGDHLVGVWLEVGWSREFGSRSLAAPSAFASVVGRQPELAADAARAMLARAAATMRETDVADVPMLLPLPAVLLHPEIGQLALPNLLIPTLDRAQCARLVAVFDTIPTGAQQALRALSDQGVRLAVTASAAATADPIDLDGWQRWGVILPQHMVDEVTGVDWLTIQQTVTAIATHQTRLAAEQSNGNAAPVLLEHGIGLSLRRDLSSSSLADVVNGDVASRP